MKTRSSGAPAAPGRRELAAWSLLAVAASVGMVWGWAWQIQFNDWGAESAAPFYALLHGHLSTFLATAPAYGPSLLLRAPFALPASLAGSGGLLIYRLSALPCALALAGLGVWLAHTLRRHGAGRLCAGAAVVVCAANPIAFKALVIGHPEELLGAALCAAAVLLAMRGRANWAMLALGVAIANKEWALLAVGPVLIAQPPKYRWRTIVLAGAVAGALELPLVAASGGPRRVIVNDTGEIFHPWQVFWFFAPRGHWLADMAPLIPRGFRVAPGWIVARSHALIVWLTVPLTLLAIWRRVPRDAALLMLALFLLMRCLLDPWDLVYYPLPLIIALAAWETAVAHRFPIGAAVATAATWLIFDYLPQHIGVDAQALSFLVPATLAFVALAVAVYRPRAQRAERRAAAGAVSRPRAVPS